MRQRIAILEVLEGVRTHPPADWIYNEVQKNTTYKQGDGIP